METTTKYSTVKDVAKALSVSAATVRLWVKTGVIPADAYLRVGTTYRFDFNAVLAALKANNTTDNEE